jgi:diguanylate cyclase (GGDEF)-like protein
MWAPKGRRKLLVRPATVTELTHRDGALVAEEDRNGGSSNGNRTKIYALLARLPFPRSYLGKIMLSAFLGTHLPLIALVLYLVLAASLDLREALPVLVTVLVATLFGTLVTLYVLYALLRPVSLSSKALYDYLDRGLMPSLPTTFADQAGRLMANVQYVVEQLDEVIRSLQEASTTDHLTGVLNRRAGEQRLASDLARVARGEGALTVAVVDLDRFKPINDRYGHKAGDTCLRHLAHICVRNIREGDWLARWGGDEFVLALWEEEKGEGTPAKKNPVLDRITTDLAQTPVQLAGGSMIWLTFSAGVYLCTGGDDEEAKLQVDGVLALADEALYEAKAEGDKSTFVYAR